MSGYGYKPPAENSRVRDDESEVERKLYEEKRSKITNNASDYARRLAYSRKYAEDSQSQLNPNFPTQYTEGSQSGYFDPNADYRAGSERYYKPPDYDVPYRTYDKSYYDIFNVASPEDIFTAKEIYYNVTNDPYYTEDGFTQNLLNTRKVDPIYLHADEDLAIASYVGLDLLEKGEFDLPTYYKFIEEYGYEDAQKAVTREERYEVNTGEEYKEPQSFAEAKEMADKAYMDTLSHELKRAFYLNDEEAIAQINQALEKGVPDFQNPEDTLYVLYGGSPITNAAKEQAYLMKDYLEANDIDLYKVADLEPKSGASSTGVVDNKVWLNTGTALQHFETGTGAGASVFYKDVLETPTIGSYSFYEKDPVFVDKDLEDVAKQGLNVIATTATILAPSAAPLINAANTLAQGGDLEDVAKSVIASTVAPDILENTLGNLGVDADLFGIDAETFSEGVTEVQTAVIQGDSITDAVGSAFGGELLDAATPAIEGVLPDIDVPEAFKKAGDILASTIEPAIDTLGEVVEPIAKVIEGTANVIEETAEPITNVAESVIKPVIDTVEKAASTVGEAVEPIVDVAEVAVDKTVDVSVDVINALRASVGLPTFGETVENFDANNDGIVTAADAQQVLKDEQPEPLVEPEVPPVEPEVPPVEPEVPPAEPEVTDISLVEKTFNSFGLTGDSFGISNAEFSDTMNKVEKAMLEGKSGQEVLFTELGVEALSKLGSEAGGMFMQAINTLDPIVDAFGNVIKPVVQTVGNVIEPVVKPVVDVVETVAKPVVDVVEPVVQTVGDVGQAVVDVAEPVVTTVGDVVETVAKPVVETVEQTAPIVEDIFIDPIKEGVETVVDIGSDVLSEAEDVFIDPVKEGLEAVVEAVPEVDVTLPEINVPSFDLPSMLGMLGTTQRQPTQVENLFDKELFKFDTEIKSTQQMLSPMMNLRRYG